LPGKHVINDGAANDTTAEFRISVYEGRNSVRGYVFGDVDEFEISDRPDPGKEATEFIPLAPFCPRFVLGPKDTTDEDYEVGILTRGLVYRATGSNEEALNFFGSVDSNVNNVPDKARFHFPTGAGELVQNAPLVVRAKGHVTGVEFEYDVTARFTVEYF
jgi:hypothetical protein